ncbi:MAG TPA: hypothetical protein VKQ52_06755, partial [Puia sp.]|nr:hypothetical protein [Puia sp.]
MRLTKKYLAILLILVPVISFFGFFFRYTVNAPVNDDYPAVLQFLDQYVSTHSYFEKLRLIFAQHNEHRIVFSRVWTIISFKLQKQVNFNVLSLIGNLSLIGMGLVFLRKFLRLNLSLVLFFPVTAFLFNLASWENMTFAMCALSNFVVHLFILLSLSFLTAPTGQDKKQDRKNVLLAVLFFFAAFMTQGAGLALFPVSLLILLYKREYKNLLLYLGLAALVLLFYFYGYHKPPGTTLDIVFRDFKVRTILFVFAFLGNAFDYFLVFTNDNQESISFTAVIGALFFLLFIHITRQKYYRKNPFNYSVMLFIIVTAMLAAVNRSWMGLEIAGASRYRINGCIFCISLYLWLIETYSGRWLTETSSVRSKVATAAMVILAGWYFVSINLKHYEYLSVREETTYLEILCTKTGAPSIVYPNNSETPTQRHLIDWSSQLHVYYLPGDKEINTYFPFSRKQTDDPAGAASSGLEMTKSVHGIYRTGNDFLVDGFAFLEGRSTNHQHVFVGIKNQADSAPVFFTSKQIPRF